MKKILSAVLAITLLSFTTGVNTSAQNNLGKTDDVGRIVLSPYVVSNANIPSFAANAIKNKLTKIAADQGLAGNSVDQRFIITMNLIEMTKDVTPTAPPMVALTLAPTIYIGDAVTGDLYSSCDLPTIKGVGQNDTKAYMAAVKVIKTNDQNVIECINRGKEKIIEYYNSQIDFILAEAESMVQSQQFEEAMAKLAAVPEICKDAYMQAMNKIGEVYQKKIDIEGLELYNEAYAQWNTAKTRESAERVVELLAQINPLSSAAAKGRALVKSVESHYAEIEARRREIEERNWAFKMKQYDDKQANLVADRENNHEYRMQQSAYDYEVNMERAKSAGMAAEYALQEVKGIVKTMSNARGSNSLNSVADKVKSWFK